jgi:hypothetical protein
MKLIKNNLTDFFDQVLEKTNGGVENYAFYCSSSFNQRLKEYKGIKIFYSDLIQKGIVYYMKETEYIKNTL